MTGPGGFKVARAWPIEVRAPQLDVAREQVAVLRPGQSYTADKTLIAGIVPSTAIVALNVSASHGYGDVPGLLRWLDQYPYGCIEQTTSRAMPLLYFNDLARLAGLPQDKELHARIQDAVDNVSTCRTTPAISACGDRAATPIPGSASSRSISWPRPRTRAMSSPNAALKRGANWLQQHGVLQRL